MRPSARGLVALVAVVLIQRAAFAIPLTAHPSYEACVLNPSCTTLSASAQGLTGTLPTELGDFGALNTMYVIYLPLPPRARAAEVKAAVSACRRCSGHGQD